MKVNVESKVSRHFVTIGYCSYILEVDATLAYLTKTAEIVVENEVTIYLDGRRVLCWRLQKNEVAERKPDVFRLNVHLPDQHIRYITTQMTATSITLNLNWNNRGRRPLLLSLT